MNYIKISFLIFFCFGFFPLAADYDESTDGDLSGDRMMPTTIPLTIGSNLVSATSIAGDLEYFTITIPEGHVLSNLNLVSYTAPSVAFLAFQEGAIFSEPASGTNPSHLLGWTHLGLPLEDQLPVMQLGFGVIGYDIPLPAGTYTFWSQETSTIDPSSYTLDFVLASLEPAAAIPTLSTWMVICLGLGTFIIGVVVLQQSSMFTYQ